MGGRSLLSEATGGLSFHTANDFNKMLRRVMEDQSGYYLLGYRPSEVTFKGGRAGYRRISVKVNRPGLSVRTRAGFTAVTDADALIEEPGSASRLYSTSYSPSTPAASTCGHGGLSKGADGSAAARMLLHTRT